MAVFLIAPLVLKNIWLGDDEINYTISETVNEKQPATTRPKYEKTDASLIPFNPNTASEEELKKLGIEDFIAKRIINYRSKGGRFRIKKDLLKIYDFPESRYAVLKSYILLPDSLQTHYYSLIDPFDINTCDTTALIKLKGIGSVLAGRIISYRTKLGGFVKAAQVKEVYGVDPLVGSEIEQYLFVKPGFKPKKINLNLSTADELSAHPYLTKKEANVIVNYRNEHGSFTSVSELSAVKIFTTEQLRKLTPYLEVN